MLNVKLYFYHKKLVNKFNNKNNILLLYLVFYVLLKQFNCISKTKSTKKTIKTLLLSPFHYKVAKKLIAQININTTLEFNIDINEKISNLYYVNNNVMIMPVNMILFFKKVEITFMIDQC